MLTETRCKDRDVQANAHVEQELNVIQRDRVGSDIGKQPHRILVAPKVAQARSVGSQKRRGVSRHSKRRLPLTLTTSKRGHPKVDRVQQWCCGSLQGHPVSVEIKPKLAQACLRTHRRGCESQTRERAISGR